MPGRTAALADGMEGLVVLLLAASGVGGFALWRRRTDGRVRPAEPAVAPEAGGPVPLTPVEIGADRLGERATLVQFSTAFCQPCRATRLVLGDVAAGVPGVQHVEVDAESHLDLVRRLGVTRTPTVLVLDSGGREVGRAVGAPKRSDVLAALAEVVS